MTILWVTFGLPYPPDSGVRVRDFHLIREVARDARVLLFCLIPHGGATDPGDLQDFCDRVEVWQMPAGLPPVSLLLRLPLGAWRNFFPEAADRISAIIAAEHPDIVQIEHSLLAAYREAVPANAQCRIVLSLHNITHEQYRRLAHLDSDILTRAGYLLKSWAMRLTERHYIPCFDRCLTVSQSESHLLTHSVPSARPVVIENGVDCASFQPRPSDGCGLLFAGVMNYPPNADAAVFFCRSILPLIQSRVPQVKLLIVGHSPPPHVRVLANHPGVTVTGRVDNIGPYYAQASVTIAPLRAGGGTRIKILESMAAGRPVVSTTMGCEGLDVQDGVHLLIADDPHRFAECVMRLLFEPMLRSSISIQARHLVEQRYDWPGIGERLLAVYRELVA